MPQVVKTSAASLSWVLKACKTQHLWLDIKVEKNIKKVVDISKMK